MDPQSTDRLALIIDADYAQVLKEFVASRPTRRR